MHVCARGGEGSLSHDGVISGIPRE